MSKYVQLCLSQEKMVGSRQKLILVGAVIAGLLAAIGLVGYVKNVKDNALDETEAIEVWTVKKEIPKLTPGSVVIEDFIEKGEAPRNLASNAVTNPDSIKDLVSSRKIPEGVILSNQDFVSERESVSGISALLESKGLVTVTVSVDETEGVSDLIEPGNYVNVLSVSIPKNPFHKQNKDDEDFTLSDISPLAIEEMNTVIAANRLHKFIPDDLKKILEIEGEEEIPKFDKLSPNQKDALVNWANSNDAYWISDQLNQRNSRYLYQKAEVIAVDKKLVPDIGESNSEGGEEISSTAKGLLVTLAVAPRDVQVILNAQLGKNDANGIYLSLVPNDYEPIPLPPVDPSLQVAPGEDPYRLVPNEDVSILEFAQGVDNGQTPDNLTFSSEGLPSLEEEVTSPAEVEVPETPADPTSQEAEEAE